MEMDMSGNPTSTLMPMATATGMASEDMSGCGMAVVFFTSFRTPLFSGSWMPSTQGEYAGTCLFLVVLSCILRFMLALKPVLEDRFWRNSKTYDDEGRPLILHQGPREDIDPEKVIATVQQDVTRQWRGWRASAAAARATYEVLLAGIGYLLMLAAMTMNVGYFLSVLGGVWLGTFLLGGLAGNSQWTHC